MNLLSHFQHYIEAEQLFGAKDRLLIAVSAGVDSVVLCELCRQSGLDFAVAHCNFQLRGSESDADEVFVKQLASDYGVTFFTKKFDAAGYAQTNKLSIQEAARNLRYEWFHQLVSTAGDKQFSCLLTAHHADDNIETLLMNFFKGTGINGLKAILPRHGKIVRPLLFAGKNEILAFAKENNLSYREDSSNQEIKYTRNYFRNQLIPGIEKVFPGVQQNLGNNIKRFRDISLLYEAAVNTAIKKLVTVKGDEWHIPVLKLIKTAASQTVFYEIIKEAGFSAQQSAEAYKLLYTSSGKYVQSSTHRILRNRNWLIVSPLQSKAIDHYLIEEGENAIDFANGRISIETTGNLAVSSDPNIALLDASAVKFPLLLRKWKQGDYFYPLGMAKKKKLSRFFIDHKLSMNEKENTWVIESAKKIVWVVGMRISDKVKLTSHTTKALKLVFETVH